MMGNEFKKKKKGQLFFLVGVQKEVFPRKWPESDKACRSNTFNSAFQNQQIPFGSLQIYMYQSSFFRRSHSHSITYMYRQVPIPYVPLH